MAIGGDIVFFGFLGFTLFCTWVSSAIVAPADKELAFLKSFFKNIFMSSF